MTNKQNTVRHEETRKYGHYANYDGVLNLKVSNMVTWKRLICSFEVTFPKSWIRSGQFKPLFIYFLIVLLYTVSYIE